MPCLLFQKRELLKFPILVYNSVDLFKKIPIIACLCTDLFHCSLLEAEGISNKFWIFNSFKILLKITFQHEDCMYLNLKWNTIFVFKTLHCFQMLAFEIKMHSFVCSQMLILPPFQGEGHGAQLLETVHRYYMSSPTVLDITGLC